MTMISKNAPCPCGSGKKFKRCCGEKNSAAQKTAPAASAQRPFNVSLWAGLLIAAVGLFYLGTLRQGHDWGGDNCQYVLHARNLAEGKPYKDTGMIYNPLSPVFPETYPPVFPALLVPLYKAFGLVFTPMKTALIFVFLAVIWLLFLFYRRTLSPPYLLGLLALIGFNPAFWNFKDYVFSEIPFLFWVGLILLLTQKRESAKNVREDCLWGLLTGLVSYLAYGTRAVGLFILPALLVYDLIRYRKIRWGTLVALAAFAPLALAQNFSFHSEAVHLKYKTARASFETFRENVFHNYPYQFAALWNGGFHSMPSFLLVLFLFVLVVYGYFIRVRRAFSLVEILVPGYLLLFLFITFADTIPNYRYFLPVSPFLAAYAVTGIERLGFFDTALKNTIFALGIFSVIFVSYGFVYSKMEWNAFSNGIDGPQEKQVYEFIRKNTAPDDIFIFWDPRIIVFYTGRRCGQYDMAHFNSERLAYYEKIGARYWVSPRNLLPDLSRVLREVYSNGKYYVYRIENYRLK